MGFLANLRIHSLKNLAIKLFIKRYGVNMNEALETDYTKYPTFNAFFTRELKSKARSLCIDPQQLASPVDGTISEQGDIAHNKIIQAKGVDYSLEDLLAQETKLVNTFQDGKFFTAYLSPKDYHRIHMPRSGKLLKMIHVPGKLFSVNPASVQGIPSLFARNERVICIFETKLGPMAVICVGAMIVGSVTTAWHGNVRPPKAHCVTVWNYDNKEIIIARGKELGHFELGSTVILLFAKDKISWLENLKTGDNIQMGQSIGSEITSLRA